MNIKQKNKSKYTFDMIWDLVGYTAMILYLFIFFRFVSKSFSSNIYEEWPRYQYYDSDPIFSFTMWLIFFQIIRLPGHRAGLIFTGLLGLSTFFYWNYCGGDADFSNKYANAFFQNNNIILIIWSLSLLTLGLLEKKMFSFCDQIVSWKFLLIFIFGLFLLGSYFYGKPLIDPLFFMLYFIYLATKKVFNRIRPVLDRLDEGNDIRK